MKVVVKKYLNVRVGSPSVNAPCYQYLAPGSELEVDGKIYKGDTYDNSNEWLKDMAGNYYWKGGVEEKNLVEALLSETQASWWLSGFHIPEIWSMGYAGRGIKIAVLDTGISYPHPDLDLDPALFHDVTGSASGTNDKYGHGTHCAGIIKASNNTIGPIGLAYNSSLYVCKVTHDSFGDKSKYFADGINWAISQGVDIISISKGDPFFNKDLEAAMDRANKANILVVCAAGNKIQGFPDDHVYYPARFGSALSVGGINEPRRPLQDSILTGETHIFAPGQDIFSTYKNNSYLHLSGSSQATPFVAAVCALYLEFKRKTEPAYNPLKIKEVLQATSDLAEFGRIINPINLFK